MAAPILQGWPRFVQPAHSPRCRFAGPDRLVGQFQKVPRAKKSVAVALIPAIAAGKQELGIFGETPARPGSGVPVIHPHVTIERSPHSGGTGVTEQPTAAQVFRLASFDTFPGLAMDQCCS